MKRSHLKVLKLEYFDLALILNCYVCEGSHYHGMVHIPMFLLVSLHSPFLVILKD